MSYYDKADEIIAAMEHFISLIGENKAYSLNVFGRGEPLPQPGSSRRDYLNKLIRNLSKTKELIDDEIKDRARGIMKEKVISCSNDIEYIINQVSQHLEVGKISEITHTLDGKNYTMEDKDYQAFLPLINGEVEQINGIDRESFDKLFHSAKTVVINNEFSMDDYFTPFKFTQRDIYKLGYYELVRLFQDHHVIDFRERAQNFIQESFDTALVGDKLEISIIGLTDGNFSLKISDEQLQELKEKNKLMYPLLSSSFTE